jgi:hypothetical protein
MSPGAHSSLVWVDAVGPLGAGAPLIGISPAKPDTESTEVMAIAAKKRFMLISFEVLAMQEFLHGKE